MAVQMPLRCSAHVIVVSLSVLCCAVAAAANEQYPDSATAAFAAARSTDPNNGASDGDSDSGASDGGSDSGAGHGSSLDAAAAAD